jgi:hypothetical protein
MKNLLVLVLAIFTLNLISCKKDTLDEKAIATLQIDNVTHTYVSKDGKRYIENTLNSQEASHVYKVNMVQGLQYRISASQPGALINQIKLTLVNKDGDLLAESTEESPNKSLIVIFPPRTGSYYITVKLENRINPQFNYRLFYEEIKDDEAVLSGYNWKIMGDWTIINPGTIQLNNHDSHIYRHLRLADPIDSLPNVSFIVRSSSSTPVNFGLLLNGADKYIQFGEYAYEFIDNGYAFLVLKESETYVTITLSSGSMSFDWESLSNFTMNFSSGVKVDLKYDSGYYLVYINDVRVPFLCFYASLNNFYIVLYDEGDGVTTIQDLHIGS